MWGEVWGDVGEVWGDVGEVWGGWLFATRVCCCSCLSVVDDRTQFACGDVLGFTAAEERAVREV